MLKRKLFRTLFVASLAAAALAAGCSRSPAPVAGDKPAPDKDAQSSNVEFEIVSEQPIDGAVKATGKVLVTEDRVASIGPVNEGRVVKFYAGQGQYVKKGQKLADLESADIAEAEADYLKALSELENARRTSDADIKFNKSTYDRTKLLVEKEITPAKNLLEAEHDLEVSKAEATNAISSAKVEVANARRKLLILGLSSAAIDRLSTEKNLPSSLFSLNAPISGIIVERGGSVGATVGSDADLFKIVDLSSVWVDANVFEKDLGRVRVGQAVQVTVTAFPDTPYAGRVSLISSEVDPETRSVRVRTVVPNRDGRLKPDMFANVSIVTAARKTAISVPLSAVLEDGGRSIVYVADGDGYKKKDVTLGIKSEDRVEIVSGLSAGDKVVVKGNYLLLEQGKAGQ